jgi:hypothetical protein
VEASESGVGSGEWRKQNNCDEIERAMVSDVTNVQLARAYHNTALAPLRLRQHPSSRWLLLHALARARFEIQMLSS